MTGTIVQKYINALYVVMYDRAADSNGYNYWLSTVTGATSQTAVTDAIAQTMAGSFRAASSTYFNTQYAALTDTNFILQLYANLGNSSSGVGGDALNYWQGRLESFGGDRAKLAGDFTKAFLEYDGDDAAGLLRKAAFENKVAVSQAWVDASRTNAFMNAAAPTDAAFAAEVRILNGVDHTTASLNVALAQVNSVVSTRDLARAAGVDPVGSRIVLTDETDDLVGTDGDDLFIGRAGIDYDNPLATADGADMIDGGEGRDVLKLALYENDDDPGLVPTTINVEVLEFSQNYSDDYQISNMTGLEEVRFVDTMVNNFRDVELYGVQNLVDVTMSNVNQHLVLNYLSDVASASNDAVTVTLNRVQNVYSNDASLEFDMESSGDVIETVSIVSSGSYDNELDFLGDAGVKTLNVSGSANLVLDDTAGFRTTVTTVNVTGSLDLDMSAGALTKVTTFAAGSATGDISAVISGTQNVSVTTGTGSDDFDLTANTGTVTVNVGGGDDIVAVDVVKAASVITGGDGVDQLWVYEADMFAQNIIDGITGFEELWLRDESDANVDLTYATGFSEIHIADPDDNESYFYLNDISASLAQNIFVHENDDNANILHALYVRLANTSGVNDTVKMTFISRDGSDNTDYIIEDTYAHGVENITLTATGGTQVDLDYLYADDLRRLTITGDADFDLDDVEARDIISVDASLFTGEEFRISEIDTDDDFEFVGGASSNTYLYAESGDDVDVRTFAGDDYIELDGDANNVSADVYVSSGDGDDDINVYDFQGDIEIFTGAGDDDVNAWNHGAFVIDVGAGDDVIEIEVDDNVDSYTITLGEGDDELIVYNADVGWSLETSFVVTDFVAADDLIGLDTDENTLEFVTSSNHLLSIDVTGADQNTETVMIELNWEADNNGVDLADLLDSNGYLTDSQILEALGSTGDVIIDVDGGEEGFLLFYAGGNAFLASYADDGDGNILDSDDEVALLGVMYDVEVGALSIGNFYTF